MKKIILFYFIIFSLHKAYSGGEVRQCIIEPFPPIVTLQDSIMNVYNYPALTDNYYSPMLFKFYDTLVRFDEPYTDLDTVTAVGWTFYLPRQPF
jgi:hypothetical protein